MHRQATLSRKAPTLTTPPCTLGRGWLGTSSWLHAPPLLFQYPRLDISQVDAVGNVLAPLPVTPWRWLPWAAVRLPTGQPCLKRGRLTPTPASPITQTAGMDG